MPAAITVSPSSARIDVDRAITLTGFDPGARVTLTATSRLADHTVWQSTNVYVANAHGAVSIAEQAPVIGDYEGVDSQGPLWSQVLRPPEVAAEVEPDATDLIDASDATVATVTPDAPAGPAHPVSVWFTATDETGHVARATLEQRY
ncbi:MAG: acyl-CoA thioesterase/BAAT N-terminal domain-containing protein, partial [Burkholderiaceae bacterium]